MEPTVDNNAVNGEYASAATMQEVQGMSRITDVSALADRIMIWHNDAMQQCAHVLGLTPDMMDNDEAQVVIHARIHNTDDPMERVPKDMLRAFQLGISFALQHLGELPVKFVPTDADGKVLPEFSNGTDDAEEETKAD